MLFIKKFFLIVFKIWMILSTLIVTGGVVLMIAVFIWEPDILKKDRCLDAGGSWNEGHEICEKS
jgi:hypothetical protein